MDLKGEFSPSPTMYTFNSKVAKAERAFLKSKLGVYCIFLCTTDNHN